MDRQIADLTLRLGVVRPNEGPEFVFDPSPGFYGFVAQGDVQVLNEAMQILANHLGSRHRPVVEPWPTQVDSLSTWDQDWIPLENAEAPGLIRVDGPGHGRVAISSLNAHSPHLLGAILAHELTHHFLFANRVVRRDVNENERLTDFAAVFLGLGKLLLNGYLPELRFTHKQEELTPYHYQLGYLTHEEVALVLLKVCQLRGIPIDSVRENLSERAQALLARAPSILHQANATARREQRLAEINLAIAQRKQRRREKWSALWQRFCPTRFQRAESPKGGMQHD